MFPFVANLAERASDAFLDTDMESLSFLISSTPWHAGTLALFARRHTAVSTSPVTNMCFHPAHPARSASLGGLVAGLGQEQLAAAMGGTACWSRAYLSILTHSAPRTTCRDVTHHPTGRFRVLRRATRIAWNTCIALHAPTKVLQIVHCADIDFHVGLFGSRSLGRGGEVGSLLGCRGQVFANYDSLARRSMTSSSRL